MAKATKITGGTHVDTHELKAFVRDLRATYPKAAKGLRENLRASGMIVATEARRIAGEHSESIPPTIRPGVYGANVSVKAGNTTTPLAAVWELGNKGSKGKGDTFRHPVFGRKDEPWVEQARYPFLRPAVKEAGPAMEAEILKTVHDIVDILTLGGH